MVSKKFIDQKIINESLNYGNLEYPGSNFYNKSFTTYGNNIKIDASPYKLNSALNRPFGEYESSDYVTKFLGQPLKSPEGRYQFTTPVVQKVLEPTKITENK